jgi:hypothetical protein
MQQAAFEILKAENRPLLATEIAKRVLEKGLKTSDAKDPINSFAQTLEKNIRDGIYNDPKLVFLHTARGRLVGLPSWEKQETVTAANLPKMQEITLQVPVELFEMIQWATQAKVANSFEETLIFILKAGLSTIAPKIKEGLAQQMKKLDAL